MRVLMRRLLRDERGATAMEYGLLVALIAVCLIGAMTAVGTNVKGTMNSVSNTLTAAR